MFKEFNGALYVLLVIGAAVLTASEQHEKFCGPLKVRLSEYEACYNGSSENKEIPCPNRSEEGATVLKLCRPPYSYKIGFLKEQILNVTYTCKGKNWWPPYDYCQSDCGRSTANNKYPWLAAIYDENEELKCTATIISAYHLLTDKSCIRATYVKINNITTLELDASNYTIIAGKHYSNIHRKKRSAQIRKIKKVTFTNDQDSLLTLLEVDSEFEFFDDVQPICIDWSNYYENTDLTEGNEAVLVAWDYNKDQVVPHEDPEEFNVQFWHLGTCINNIPIYIWEDYIMRLIFCGTYIKDNQLEHDKHRGEGLYFKSSPWRYYLKGVLYDIYRQPEVTHILFSTVSLHLAWLEEQMKLHPKIHHEYSTKDMKFLTTNTGCGLPGHIKYGRFKLVFGETYRPSAWVPTGTRILLICAADRYETPISTRCKLGEWQPSIDKLECQRPGTCPALLSSAGEDIFCRHNGQNVSCTEPENNTTAIIRCKPFHAIWGNKPVYKCEDGLWDQPLVHCSLECGTKRVDVSTLTIGGSEISKNEYPWVVAIYRSKKLICGGTIISRFYVLSAAHCFTTTEGTPRQKKLYTIYAGKHYRNFSAEESTAQSRKIKALYIHEDYKGSLQKHRDDIALVELDEELTPSLEVQPVCVDWDNTYEDLDFIEGVNAVVTGWGYTKQEGSPSQVLKKLVVPYRPKNVCMANLPKDFSHQYVVTDKICAGYKDNNMSVCNGDSGGGLYFKSADNRFYIRGIVSLTAVTRARTCHANRFALYTKVSKYLPWMEKITRKVL